MGLLLLLFDYYSASNILLLCSVFFAADVPDTTPEPAVDDSDTDN